MPLTIEQRRTLKTWLKTNHANKNDEQAAEALNAQAEPVFWVWRTRVTEKEIWNDVSPANTTMPMAEFTGVARTPGERDGWRQLFSVDGTIDPSKPGVRQHFADIFPSGGTGSRAHLLAMSRRPASNGEKALASGTGSAQSPATMGAEGPFRADDVVDAFRTPDA